MRFRTLIAQSHTIMGPVGLCLPIAINYVAAYIDSIVENRPGVLEAYRRRVSQLAFNPQTATGFERDRLYFLRGVADKYKGDGSRIPWDMGMTPEEHHMTRSLTYSGLRCPRGILQCEGMEAKELFDELSGHLYMLGIYYITLMKEDNSSGHALVFINDYNRDLWEKGTTLEEYRFLDANTGEFEWSDPYITDKFFRIYYDRFLAKREPKYYVSYVMYYPIEREEILRSRFPGDR